MASKDTKSDPGRKEDQKSSSDESKVSNDDQKSLKEVEKNKQVDKSIIIKPSQGAKQPDKESVEKCSICSEGMFNEGPKKEDTLSTKCGHKFHKKCIIKWFHDHTVCPIDRRECSVKYVGQEVDSIDNTLAEKLKLKVSVLDNFSIGNFFAPLKFDPERKTDLALLGFANMRPELAITNFCIESNVVVSLDGVILSVLKHWTPDSDPMDDDLIIRGEVYPHVDRIIFSSGALDRSLASSELYKNFIADTSSARSKAHKERYEKFRSYIRESNQASVGARNTK